MKKYINISCFTCAKLFKLNLAKFSAKLLSFPAGLTFFLDSISLLKSPDELIVILNINSTALYSNVLQFLIELR